MKRINKLALILIISLLFAGLSLGCGESGDEYIIGSLHPLTGQNAYEGQAIVNAQQIAVDEINGMGGVGGKKLRLITVDTTSKPNTASSAALKLIDRGAVAITGSYTSATAKTISREAEKCKVPFVITVASDGALLSYGNRYTFRIQPSTVTFGDNFIEYIKAVKTDDMKTVGIIYEDSNYGKSIAERILDRIEETGLNVVCSVSYSASAASLASEVTRISALSPDILVPIGYYSDQTMLMKEIFDRGIEFGLVMGVANGAISHPSFINAYGEEAEGYYDINYSYDPANERAMNLLSEYEKRYGEEMPRAAVYGYQSVMVIAAALEKSGDGKELRDSISSLYLTDHLLPYEAIAFDERGECIFARGVVIRITDKEGKVVYPKSYREG